MGIREQLNKHPHLITIIAISMIVIVLVLGMSTSRRTSLRQVAAIAPRELFFTVDDGKTFFTGDGSQLAPFDHNGAEAYQAVVYQCGSGPAFVGYLVRYPEAKRAELLQRLSMPQSPFDPEGSDARRDATEVKAPGSGKKWFPTGSAAGANIMFVKCPDGSSATAIIP